MKSFSSVLVFASVCFVFAENCDEKGTLIYKDIRCKPVNESGGCPTSFDCDFARPRTGCLFKGKVYNAQEEIPSDLTYSSCNVGCFCRETSILCAVLDCPEFFNSMLEPGCYPKYELGKCCSTGRVCEDEALSKTCEVERKTYKIGQRFYPKNRCLTCVCHKDFDGTYDEKTCALQNCASELTNAEKIADKCAPVYLKFDKEETALCCPSEWVCPTDSDKFEVISQETSTGSCIFGSQTVPFGHGFRKTIHKYSADRKIVCECSLPPLLTCKEE
ncbi:uncharacterized protein LOC143206437 [Rhynchophorus ferrugineus]|uniref:uncharacterized protein LOC143206437 n=1 Tax=Rhynchophorus ferrugineus TaxID=354439 RepID=UPI003FCEB122